MELELRFWAIPLAGNQLRSSELVVPAFSCWAISPDPVITHLCNNQHIILAWALHDFTVTEHVCGHSSVLGNLSWVGAIALLTQGILEKEVNHVCSSWHTMHLMTRFKWSTNEQSQAWKAPSPFSAPSFLLRFPFLSGLYYLQRLIFVHLNGEGHVMHSA